MFDQLASWLQVVIGFASLILSVDKGPRRKKPTRRIRRVLRYRHFKGWGIERTRLDVIDDSRL
jgi:hypothetical protein